MRRGSTPSCHHRDYDEDMAHHTLKVCAAWALLRRELVAIIDTDDLAVISRNEAADCTREELLYGDMIRLVRLGPCRREYLRLRLGEVAHD